MDDPIIPDVCLKSWREPRDPLAPHKESAAAVAQSEMDRGLRKILGYQWLLLSAPWENYSDTETAARIKQEVQDMVADHTSTFIRGWSIYAFGFTNREKVAISTENF